MKSVFTDAEIDAQKVAASAAGARGAERALAILNAGGITQPSQSGTKEAIEVILEPLYESVATAAFLARVGSGSQDEALAVLMPIISTVVETFQQVAQRQAVKAMIQHIVDSDIPAAKGNA